MKPGSRPMSWIVRRATTRASSGRIDGACHSTSVETAIGCPSNPSWSPFVTAYNRIPWIPANSVADLPRVALIVTGGTIDSVGVDRLDLAWYLEAGKRLPEGELLERLPELAQVAS